MDLEKNIQLVRDKEILYNYNNKCYLCERKHLDINH